MAREYVFSRTLTNPGAVTALQIAAGTAMPFVVLGATITQRASATSAQFGAELVRKTAAATVTAAVAGDIKKYDPGDAATVVQLGTALTGYLATAEGTDGDALDMMGTNVLNGYILEPQPEVRTTVPGAGIIALKFTTAPPAGTYDCQIKFAEGLSG